MCTATEACAMNHLLARQIAAAVDRLPPGEARRLGCEDSLRAAAATLQHSGPGGITATTLVGNLPDDNALAIEQLVADIAAEHGLNYRFRQYPSAFSVRFSRFCSEGNVRAARNEATVTRGNAGVCAPARQSQQDSA